MTKRLDATWKLTMRRFQSDRSNPLKVFTMTLKPQLPSMYIKTFNAAKVWNRGVTIDCVNYTNVSIKTKIFVTIQNNWEKKLTAGRYWLISAISKTMAVIVRRNCHKGA